MALRFISSLEDLPPNAALAVGTFDGVHRGHLALIDAMLDYARTANRPACILTFTNSPRSFFHPEQTPSTIFDAAHLAYRLVKHIPSGTLLRLTFDATLANLSAIDFATALKGATIFCGEDWRFGRGAEGSPTFLREHGFDVHVIPYARYQDERISSTRIRQAMQNGRMDDVAAMLGTPWSFSGTVVHGRGLAGKLFGVPTLNIPYPASRAPLAHGAYRATVQIQERTFDALLNFGTAPSLKGERHPLFEAHLLDLNEDLYGQTATLLIDTPLLRPEQKFDTLDALKAQIHADLAQLAITLPRKVLPHA